MRMWEAIGGRKFLGYQETLAIILGIGFLVKDYRTAGVLVSGALLAFLIYVQANIKAKFKIGDSEITTEGNGKEAGTNGRDSEAEPR